MSTAARPRTTNDRSAPISPSLSVVLDLTRLVLSLLVAIGHWTQPFFQDGWPDLTRLAVASVGGFFVLSGFTIRMIEPPRPAFVFRTYLVERSSRILSVTIPALALTVLLDWLAGQVAPDVYQHSWGGQADRPVQRLLVNLVGLSQVWGLDVSPLSNSPFWSISYEIGFYLIFGLWMAGYRRSASLAAIGLGPNIAIMFPLWWLGGMLYDRLGREGRVARTSLSAITAVVMGFIMLSIGAYLVGGPLLNSLFAALGVGRGRVSRVLIASALAFAGGFAGALWVTHRLPSGWASPTLVRRARQLGTMTFPLYLYHFPLFVAISALQLYDRRSTPQKAFLFGIVLLLVAALTPLGEHLKRRLRSLVTPPARPAGSPVPGAATLL